MKAAVLEGPHNIPIRQVDIPAPNPRQVRVKLEGSGVCASNLASWEGMPWTQYPFAPGGMGHEGWGIVDAVGADVRGIAPGERVAFLGYNSYAEYDLAESDAVVKLPAALNSLPFPGEALGCAMNIFKRSQIESGQTVCIVGAGFLGTLLTRLAANAGAHVIAVSRRSSALEIARAMGAAETLPLTETHRVIAQVKDLTAGRLCDRVIEAVGKQQPLDLSAELTRERGRLIIAGYHQDGPRQVNMQLWNWRGLDVVNAHERDPRISVEGMREAVAQVVSGAIDPRPLFTHTYPLEKIAEALDATRDRPDGFMKALVFL